MEGMEPQQMEQQAQHLQNEAQEHAVAHDQLAVAAQELNQKASMHMHAQVQSPQPPAHANDLHGGAIQHYLGPAQTATCTCKHRH